MNVKQIFMTVIVVAIIAVVGILFAGGLEKNNAQNWQHVQTVRGNVTIRDKAGWYPKWFATVTTYPRFVENTYNDIIGEGKKAKESVGVTFNDGGEADISTFTRWGTPVSIEQRMEFHKYFSGNIVNAASSVKAHLINCAKATAPLMSASENQSARKAEFSMLIEEQLANGLFEMKMVERTLKDQFDEEGKPITVFATEIIKDENGKSVVAKISPLVGYGIRVLQFSITSTEYDTETRKQFAAKKQSFLKAEQSKAQKAEMVAERLKIEEEGKKDKAQQEAISNVAKAEAVIAAELKAEVALQTKIEAETKASQLLSVAEINKKEMLMIASAKFEVAEIKAKEAEQEKIAAILKAQGRKEAIELSGDITEIEQAMIDAGVEKARVAAGAFAKMAVPKIMFIGGSGSEGGTNLTEYLINYRLMEASGLIDKTNVNESDVNRKVRPAVK